MNKYNEYPKEIRQLLNWNFNNVEEVEQRHFDSYLKKVAEGCEKNAQLYPGSDATLRNLLVEQLGALSS